eukprot:1712380-Rhodomonas_salina.1
MPRQQVAVYDRIGRRIADSSDDSLYPHRTNHRTIPRHTWWRYWNSRRKIGTPYANTGHQVGR